MKLNVLSFARLGVLAAAAGLAVACDSSPSQPSIEDRQNAALKDPFSYGPATPNPKAAPVPEKKERDESLNGEWKRFWNP